MNDNQKGTKLEGQAVDDEVLDSASNILTIGGQDKGLQQFYSPEPLAKFVANILDRQACIDLTAGDGSLLSQFPEENRYGVEIDKDQVGNGSYTAIQGDVQTIAPLLIELNAEFKVAALNPPFGLKWSDPTINGGKDTNSAVVTLAYALRMLEKNGSGVLVTGGDGSYDEAIKPFIEGLDLVEDGYRNYRPVVYAVIDVDNIWAEARVSNQLVLFGWQRMRGYGEEREAPSIIRYQKELNELNDPQFLSDVKRVRDESCSYSSWDYSHDSKHRTMLMKAVQGEYDRLRNAGKKIRKMDMDVWANGNKLVVKPRPFVNIKLAGSHALNNIKHLHKQPLSYFAMNEKRWQELLAMQEQGTIQIDPLLPPRVEQLIAETRIELTPMTQLKPQQRLAYLEDIEQIECTTAHERNGREFVAGEKYPIVVRPIKRTEIIRNKSYKTKDGTPDVADFKVQKWILEISIEGCRFYENKEDIEHLVEHFHIPDPGTVDDLYPELIEAADKLLDEIEADLKTTKRLKDFQRMHLRRLIVKKRGLLAHEQGLGKTIQGLFYAEAMVRSGAQEAVLIICPQDLIPQWQREAKEWFGRDLVHLKRHDEKKSDFLKAKRDVAAGKPGWYITHYEALSRVGKKEAFIPETLRVGHRHRHTDERTEHVWNSEKGITERIVHPAQDWYEDITRLEQCPNCGTGYREGYKPQGPRCAGHYPHSFRADDDSYKHHSSECGWTPHSIRRKAPYDIIKKTFSQGVRIIDELTQVKGESQRSKAVRGIKAKYTIGMTGTPIKNYAPDAYWGLWLCLGDSTPRFPFHYEDGKTEFENEFTTVEWRLDAYGKVAATRRLPEVSNISKLWKLLAPNVCRLRKEECGEPLVERTFYPTLVPCGVNQRATTEKWLMGFADFFKWLYPDHRLVQKGLHEWMAPMLGLQQKLEWAATMPEADPHHQSYWVEHLGKLEPATNWTPKNARVLELAMHHAAAGDKVLIGSALKAPGRWLADELNERGVKAINILAKTEDEDDLKTLPPAKRAKIVQEFQLGDAQVLVSSHALNLGHNLDKGNVVILTGLPWDYATFDQFIARVHRLTSERGVKVYVVLAKGTVDERKWKLLVDKASAANLALDGRLIEEQEEQISEAEILQQMIEAGIPVDGTEVLESDLESAWRAIESPDDLPELVLEGTPVTDLTELVEPEDEETDDAVRDGEDPKEGVEAPADEGSDQGTEQEGPETEEGLQTPYLAVSGRGNLDTIEAYLYGGNEVQWHWVGLNTGKVACIIASHTHSGFGSGPQADRLRSGVFAVREFATYQDAVDGLAPTWDYLVAREEEAIQALVTDATKDEVPSQEPESELDEVEELDLTEEEPDEEILDRVSDALIVVEEPDSEPDNDYLIGF